MIGITSFGTYIPRYRLTRKTAIEELSRPSPDTGGLSQGERSVCNADEDPLTLSVEAARCALNGMGAHPVDALFLSGTTLPFADRLNAAMQKSALGLSDRLRSADFAGTVRAGTSALLTALSTVKAGDANAVLVTATDQRQADPGSPEELLYGDGAGAVVVGKKEILAEYVGGISITRDFPDRVRARTAAVDYRWEDRWSVEQGLFPLLREGLDALFEKLELTAEDVDRFVLPTPSPAASRRVARELGLPSERIADDLLGSVGDTGTAHPLLLLSYALETAAPGSLLVVAGVGGGCDVLAFRIPEDCSRKKRSRGVAATLAKTTAISHYAKFLTLRGVLAPASGIRGEVQTKTALSVLHREHEMLFGLVGGRCDSCGTPQFPKGPFCVHPSCRRPDSLSPYRFADREATVRTFTGDYLLPSPTPPSLYGLIQFDGGGRMTAEFTDCTLDNLRVGCRVRMVFRRRYEDKERGFSGYFWKAVPVDTEEAP